MWCWSCNRMIGPIFERKFGGCYADWQTTVLQMGWGTLQGNSVLCVETPTLMAASGLQWMWLFWKKQRSLISSGVIDRLSLLERAQKRALLDLQGGLEGLGWFVHTPIGGTLEVATGAGENIRWSLHGYWPGTVLPALKHPWLQPSSGGTGTPAASLHCSLAIPAQCKGWRDRSAWDSIWTICYLPVGLFASFSL